MSADAASASSSNVPSSIVKYLQWNQWLSNARVTTVLQSEPKVLNVKADDHAVSVLSFLLENKISSAPVWDEEKKEFVGSVCLLDLITLVSGLAEGMGFVDGNRPLGQVRADEVAGLSFRNPWRVITDQAALIVAMDIMASKHIHRLAVMESPENPDSAPSIRGYITETSLARFLIQRAKEKLGSDSLDIKVSDFHHSPVKKVVSVALDKPLRVAFDTLWMERISAVAVVDENGKVCGTVSASDLKHLPVGTSLEEVRKIMNKPISEFLDAKKKDEEAEGDQAAFFFATTVDQVTATLDDTIAMLLSKLETHRVHRVWLVDSDRKPIGVISLTDVFGELEHIDTKVQI